MVEWNKDRHYKICIQVSHMSASEVGTSETLGIVATVPILEWKWDMIDIGFMTRLPRTTGGYDAIWVIVDRLT